MGRLPTALWLTFSTTLGGCLGPISDFPKASDSDRGGPEAMHPAPALDGSVLPPPIPADDGQTNTPPWGSAADGGSGAFPGFDAGAPIIVGEGGLSGDAGSEAGCSASSDTRDAGGCFGALCSTTLTTLMANTSRGACNDETSLSLACDGQISRSAALCAQNSTTSLWSDEAVRSCLRSEPSLDTVPEACLDCYADELRCTLSHCLVACVTLEDECSLCREQHCGAAFSQCSGISAH